MEDLKKIKQEMRNSFQRYAEKIFNLRKKQEKIMEEFVSKLEKAKIEEIKNKINE